MNTQSTRHERSDLCLVFGRHCRLTPRWSRRLSSVLTCHRGARLRANR
jgi:hypothetical protein